MTLAKKLFALTGLTLLSMGRITLFAQAPDRAAFDGVTEIYPTTNRTIAVGMDRDDVLERLGQPVAKLTSNIWAYPRFTVAKQRAGEPNETLIVFLANDRVRTLFVGNDADVASLIEDLRAQVAAARAVAAK